MTINKVSRNILFSNSKTPVSSILLHDSISLCKILWNPSAKADFRTGEIFLNLAQRYREWRYGLTKPDVPANVFNAIEGVLRNRGGEIDGAQSYFIKREACSTTEFSYTLQVGRHPSAKPETAKSFETDIEDSLYKVLGNVNCRVAFKPLRIIVDRNTEKKFLLRESWATISLLEKNIGLCVPGYGIGDDISFYQLKLLNHVGLSVMAKSGFGKTQLLLSTLLTLCRLNSPDYLSLIIVDPKERDFPALESLPHLACPIIYEYSQALVTLRLVLAELENRRKQRLPNYRPIIVVLDELADLVDALDKEESAEFEMIVKRIGQKGRSFGIYLIGSSQRAYEVPENIRNKLELKIAGRCGNNNDAFAATGQSGLDLTKLAVGEFEIHPTNERLKGFFIADDKSERYRLDIAWFVNSIAHGWLGIESHYRVDGPPVAQTVQESPQHPETKSTDGFIAYCKSINATGVKTIQQAYAVYFGKGCGTTTAQKYRDILLDDRGSDEGSG